MDPGLVSTAAEGAYHGVRIEAAAGAALAGAIVGRRREDEGTFSAWQLYVLGRRRVSRQVGRRLRIVKEHGESTWVGGDGSVVVGKAPGGSSKAGKRDGEQQSGQEGNERVRGVARWGAVELAGGWPGSTNVYVCMDRHRQVGRAGQAGRVEAQDKQSSTTTLLTLRGGQTGRTGASEWAKAQSKRWTGTCAPVGGRGMTGDWARQVECVYVCMYVGSDGREGAGYEKSRALVRGRRLQQHVQAWAMAGVQVLFSFGPELAPAPGMRRPVMAMAGGGDGG